MTLRDLVLMYVTMNHSLSIRVDGETETVLVSESVQIDILTDSAATDVDQPIIPSDWLGDARATGVNRNENIGGSSARRRRLDLRVDAISEMKLQAEGFRV